MWLPDSFEGINNADKSYLLSVALTHTTSYPLPQSDAYAEAYTDIIYQRDIEKTVKTLFGEEVTIPYGIDAKWTGLYKWHPQRKGYCVLATGGFSTKDSKVLEYSTDGSIYTMKVIHYNFGPEEYPQTSPDKRYKDAKGRTVYEHQIFNEKGTVIGKVKEVEGQPFPETYEANEKEKELVHIYKIKKTSIGQFHLIGSTTSNELKNPSKPQIQLGDFKEDKRTLVDLNKDGVKDKIVQYSKGSGQNPEDRMIVLYNGKDSQVIHKITNPDLYIGLDKVEDCNGDGYPDLMIALYSGGTAGTSYQVLLYDGGKYIPAEYDETDMQASFQDGFKVKVYDTSSGKGYTLDLNKEQQQAYRQEGIFNAKGQAMNKDLYLLWHPGGYEIKDIDKDGKKEFLIKSYVGILYNAESITDIIEVYKWQDGKFRLNKIIGEIGHTYQ